MAPPPSTLKTALLAAVATAIVMAGTAVGYRFYAEQQVEAAADAVRARAYAEVTAELLPPAAVMAGGERAEPRDTLAAKPAVAAEAATALAATKPQPAEVVPGTVEPQPKASAAAKPAEQPDRKIAGAQTRAAAVAAEIDKPAKRTAVAKARPLARDRVASRTAPTERARRAPQRTAVASSDGPPAKDRVASPSPLKSLDVDAIYHARSARECARGLVGLICREWLKASLCLKHQAYGKASVCPEERPVREFWTENSNTA